MGWLQERVRKEGDVFHLGRTSTTDRDLENYLVREGSCERAVHTLNLEPIDLVAGLAVLALGDEGDPGPPLVTTRPPRHALASALGEDSLAGALPGVTRPELLGLVAGLNQMHDFWEASHQAAQQADDLGERSISAYWHGIAHRREPDPGNAAYWFRRVGRHELFDSLGREAASLLGEGQGRGPRFLKGGVWDPFAFIEFCQAAAGGPDELLARRLQRLEMERLLEFTTTSVGVS